MKTVARSLVWWPGIDKDLETLVKRCKDCQENRPMPPEAPVHPWEWPQRAWQRIHVDFAGPFQGNMFFVVVDAFSKWPEVVQMSTTTADRTVDVLRRIFSRNGLPDQLVSDNGPQFVSETFQDFMKYNGIRHTTSAPYHPRTNGLAERLVQTLKQSMRASKVEETSITNRLANFLLTYRSSPHSTTGETPAKLFLGRELCTRLTRLKPNVRNTVEAKQESMHYRTSEPVRQFNTGDKVAVRDYRSNNEKWVSGKIDSKTGPLSYKVEITPGTTWRRRTDQIRSADFTNSADTLIHDDTLAAKTSDPTKKQSPELTPIPTYAPAATSVSEKRYPTRTTRNVLPKRYQ
ncbi:uncharacterized protein K02A2.6-like [Saccostrea echinata]|uniref:uncharacterized protein K02A2.6-like n=1 Tax=Saccostrea echinata TaxID=191078 RepID=UPI002A82159A|nr:uncharacterized protein K02A2.6-like [Saccostrea echinata]